MSELSIIGTQRLKEINILTLAFLGDAVFELLAREHIILNIDCNLKKGHESKINLVCCKAQSELVDKIISNFSSEELNIYNRGRRSKIKNFPKGTSKNDYRKATGLEALAGYLYLTGQNNRLRKLLNFNSIVET